MFITDKNELKKYTTEHRVWQGIPGIEMTSKGRMFATFYSGGIKEELDNYVMLVKSEDGVNFSEPIAVAFKKDHRCFDPCLWIDPLGRLWFTWSLIPNHGTYAVVCDDPDAEELVFSDVRFIGNDVMMNKPTVLSTGEWLFPIAVWNDGIRVLTTEYDTPIKEKGSFVYKTVDNGETFERLGGADIENRSFDEHMVIELKDGQLAVFVRTNYGIGVSYSYDGGRNWTEGKDSGLGGPSSRFFIRRLPSGRILLVNHDNSEIRNNLTAYLSEDECKTWKYQLLLDERENVSYPDATIGPDGYIYIAYDRERGVLKKSMDEVYECAREILYAKITEEDIMAGKIVSPESKLRCIISKLNKYSEEHENPFREVEKFTAEELASHLLKNYPDCILDKILEYYSINCVNMHKLESKKFDELAASLESATEDKHQQVTEMIALVRSVSDIKIEEFPIVDVVKRIIMENKEDNLSVKAIAQKADVSEYYMMHQFKKATGTTITKYQTALKITCAKKLLLNSTKSITEIAQECGFTNSSYFSKVFMQSEHVLPSKYRKLLRNSEEKK